MTHTLHRQGSPEELGKDFVFLATVAQAVERKGTAANLRKVFEIMLKYDPINFGEVKIGPVFRADKEKMYENIKDKSYIHFVFDDRDKVKEIVEEIKKEDPGVSVVLSGLIEEVGEICRANGMQMHTVEYSGGIFGRVELLPEKPVQEITTMCGHGLIAGNLVKGLIEEIKKGRKTVEEASVELAKQCQCGIFNPQKAEQSLQKLLQEE